MPVDPRTYNRFLSTEKKARDHGLALIEALDHAGLLLTDQRQHNIRVQAVEDVYRRLERQSPNKIMSHYIGRVEGTSSEMFAALQGWFEAVCRNLANKTLEDL
jgi:hypothetical protein